MRRLETKEAILQSKSAKGLKWGDLADATGLSREFVCSACLGMNRLDPDSSAAVVGILGLGPDVASDLQHCTHKSWSPAVPTDPLIYRWYELVGVYGETIKEIINEEFGDGIMSAIDFSMTIDKEESADGDRVRVVLSGKFLPYKAW